jgi:hypothetical protein
VSDTITLSTLLPTGSLDPVYDSMKVAGASLVLSSFDDSEVTIQVEPVKGHVATAMITTRGLSVSGDVQLADDSRLQAIAEWVEQQVCVRFVFPFSSPVCFFFVFLFFLQSLLITLFSFVHKLRKKNKSFAHHFPRFPDCQIVGQAVSNLVNGI